jgi:hypothetical protein
MNSPRINRLLPPRCHLRLHQVQPWYEWNLKWFEWHLSQSHSNSKSPSTKISMRSETTWLPSESRIKWREHTTEPQQYDVFCVLLFCFFQFLSVQEAVSRRIAKICIFRNNNCFTLSGFSGKMEKLFSLWPNSSGPCSGTIHKKN